MDGSLTGSVHATGRLVIGPEAHVQAQVEVDELVVEGLVEGEVRAHQRAELLPSGRVVGDLTAPRLKVALGAVLQGRCSTAPVPPRQGSGQAPDPDAQARDSAEEIA